MCAVVYRLSILKNLHIPITGYTGIYWHKFKRRFQTIIELNRVLQKLIISTDREILKNNICQST